MSESDLYSRAETASLRQPPRQKHFMSFLVRGKPDPIPRPEEREFWPERISRVFSYTFLWWMNGLLAVGYKRTVQSEDLYLLNDAAKIDYMYNRFISKLTPIVNKLKKKHVSKKLKARNENSNDSSVCIEDDLKDFEISPMHLAQALFLTFWLELSAAGVLKILSDVGTGLLPLLQKSLINFVEVRSYGVDNNMGKGVGYALGCSFLTLFNGITYNHMFYRAMMTGARAKAVLTKLLLEKSFTVDGQGKHKFPIGKINSMLGTDLSRIDFAVPFLLFPILFPVPLGIIIGLLINNLGAPALLGISIFFFTTAAVAVVGVFMMKLRVVVNVFTDKRVNLIKELLKNFKVIKFYSWENSYLKNIIDTRKRETDKLFYMQVASNGLVSLALTAPILASMATFLLVHRLDTGRNVGEIFSSVSLFENMAMQFMFVPVGVASGADAFIGLKRVASFLSSGDAAEVKNGIAAHNLKEEGLAIKVTNASFVWPVYEEEREEEEREEEIENKKGNRISSEDTEKKDASEEFTILVTGNKTENVFGFKDLNFEIKKGEFVVITGVIGSGKSSLLYALSGFMTKTKGDTYTNGSLLLCGYPWVQNATVKENILFGLEYDEEKYNTVINTCSLVSDFDILPAGDRTEVGERGITLSGGQKARINLARAVYADRDIILMDDVLSAVDARVGKYIMDECIMGVLAGKTRVLATHQLSLISQAHRVIFLDGDGSVDIGTMKELSDRNEGFNKLMSHSSETNSSVISSEINEEEKEEFSIKEQTTKTINENEEDDGKLVQEEERAVNAITLDVYLKYLKAGSSSLGWGFAPLLLLVGTIATFCELFTNTWLAFWSEQKFPGRSAQFYSGLYVMFSILACLLMIIEFTMLAYFCNRAAKTLNIKSAENLMHVPMSFIDTTPMGRILNRFTKDTEVLDNEISDQIRGFIFPCLTIIGVLILCIIYLPWFAIVIPFLVFLYALISSFYQATSREVKRLEAVARSKVYSHFNEALGGMDTIKAYGDEKRFIMTLDNLVDKMNEPYYVSIAVQRWLALNLELIASGLILILSFLCVTRQFSISGASTGLLLSYAFTIGGALSFMLRCLTQMETELNSAERLIHYGYNLVQEAPYEIPERDPDPAWPSEGKIKFENVSMSYRPELPYALNDLSIDVRRQEKIGICGRTGAGKSTIITAIYRLAELGKGKITIDDVDISTLGLHKLRSSLSIIPQDPVLFSGSIRDNLDPFRDSTDEKLWSALRRSHLIRADELDQVRKQLKTEDKKHKFHLDQPVEEDGINFSLGERQLLALARALVRDSKILILDEATSSVDYGTDSKIQKTIAEEFENYTILCIAHRLKTIVNYDKILVMEAGRAIEFDTPWNLYNQPQSEFRSMCDNSKITIHDFEIHQR